MQPPAPQMTIVVVTLRLPAEPRDPEAAPLDSSVPRGLWPRVARMTCRKAAASMGCSGLGSRAPTRPGSEPSARATVSATLATVLLGRMCGRQSNPAEALPDDLWVAPRHRLDLAE